MHAHARTNTKVKKGPQGLSKRAFQRIEAADRAISSFARHHKWLTWAHNSPYSWVVRVHMSLYIYGRFVRLSATR